MYYRSDWPELGFSSPYSDGNSDLDSEGWQEAFNSKWRWVGELDNFESQLYGVPVCNLHLEVLDPAEGLLAGGGGSSLLAHRLRDMLQEFLKSKLLSHAYVATKLVEDEYLFQVLTEAGFQAVEHRCLYKTGVGKLKLPPNTLNNSVRYQSLAEIAQNRHDGFREQILEICTESFRRGYSRHFTDSFLLQRAPGLTYILEVMKLNFERVPASFVLLAVDTDSGHLCGFSMLSERPGSGKPQYTQLLSAVRNAYRGKGVYAGLTQLLTETLPNETQLLNVTHANNHSMQRSYEGTGRIHYADTIVLRRLVGY